MWKRIIVAFMFAVFAVSGADSQENYKGQGYLLFGVGGSTSLGGMEQIGGGGDVFVYRGLGVGGELGYLFPMEGVAYGLGLLSVNGSYNFNRKSSAKLSPFISGGYSLAFRDGYANLYNLGGGVNWWLARRIGIRVECRDYVWTGGGSDHMPMFRVGMAFR
jgi:hypothetical protein